MANFDKDRVINTTRRELERLQSQAPALLVPQIEQAKENIIQECNKRTIYITLSPVQRQRFVYHFGGVLTHPDERMLYWLYMAIEPLMAHDQIDDLLRHYFGKNYQAVKERIPKLGALLGKINFHLNNFDERKLRDGDINNPAYHATMNALMRIPFIDDTLEKVFSIIATHTSIGQITVPNQAIQIHLMQERKIQYQEEKGQRPMERAIPDG
jgi:hypothetical protein